MRKSGDWSNYIQTDYLMWYATPIYYTIISSFPQKSCNNVLGYFFFIFPYLNISFFIQMPEPTMIKKCRIVHASFSNSQGSGRRLVKICVITRQNGSEMLTAQFVDTSTDLTTANLLNMIRMWWFYVSLNWINDIKTLFVIFHGF